MAVSLKSLRVTAGFDASDYERGAAAKVAADQRMVASAGTVTAAERAVQTAATATGAAVEQTDRKISTAVTGLERFKRVNVEGYAAVKDFEKGLLTIQRGLETGGLSAAQAESALANLSKKYGIVADAADAARLKLGTELTAIIERQTAAVDKAAVAARSWAGDLGAVYAAAVQAGTGVNGAARALQALNVDVQAGRAGFAEWVAGAKGLESALRGVGAVQAQINQSTGVANQNVNRINTQASTFVTGSGTRSQAGGTLELVTGDGDASAKRYDDLAAAFGAADAELESLKATYGLAGDAQAKFEAGLIALRAELTRLGAGEEDATRILDAFSAAHDPAVRKAAELAAAQKRTADAFDAVRRSTDAGYAADVRFAQAQNAVIDGYMAGTVEAGDFAAAMAAVSRAYDPAILAAQKEAAALQAVVDKADAAGAKARAYAADLKLLRDAEAAGDPRVAGRMDELTAALKRQHGVLDETTGKTKLAAYEVTNLSYQFQDFAVQVGSGQGFFRPFLQQAPQAVGAVGGLSRAIDLLKSPTVLATAGFTALAGAAAVVVARAVQIGAQTRQLTVDLRAMGNQSGATAAQLRGIETQLKQGGVSSDAAYQSARTLAGARVLPASALGDVADIGRNMAASTGDVAGAVKALTDALSEGADGVKKLDDSYNFLTADERRQIDVMARHGDQAGVLNTAIGALHRQFDGLHDQGLGPAGKAMEQLTAGYNRLMDAIASRPLVIKGLEGLALLLDKTGRDLAGPTRAERIQEVTAELQQLDAEYARMPEQTAGVQATYQAMILRRIALQKELNQLTKEETTAQATATGPRIAGTSNARFGTPDPAGTKYVNDQAAAYDRLSEAMQGNAVQRQLGVAAMNAENEIVQRNLRGDAADNLRILRQKEALLQLTTAVNDNNRAAEAEVAGNTLLARAYGVSSAAVREAQIEQKALSEVARGTIEPYDAILDRLRKLDDAQRAVQAAQFDATLKQQTEDAQRLADAWTRGAASVHEAELANEALAEVRKRGLDAQRDSAEVERVSAGIVARDTAQRAQQFGQMANEQQKAVALANAEFGLLGQSNAARAQQVAMLQAANDLREKGADMTAAGTQAYVKQAGELARVNSLLQDAAQNAADIAQPIGTAFEDFLVGAGKASDAVKSLGDDLKRILVRQTITKPFENAVTGFLTQAMAGPVAAANDNTPVAANDNGVLGRIVDQVKGGLGSTASNAMWVRLASGSAALDAGGLAAQALSGQPMPVAIKDAGELEGAIEAASQKYGVDANLIKGIIQQESSWNANARNSSTGAAGLMQIMPANFGYLNGKSPYDPAANIDAGTKIYKEMLVRASGDTEKALSLFSGHVTTSGAAYVAAVQASAAAYAQSVKATSSVTAADEDRLQAQLDALPAQQAATTAQQDLTAAQQATINSALGLKAANDDTAAVVEVAARPMDKLADGAVSAAEAQMAAAQGAGTLANAATGFAGTIGQAASSLWTWLSSLLSSSGSTGGASGAGGGLTNTATNWGLNKAASWVGDKLGLSGIMATPLYGATTMTGTAAGGAAYGAGVAAVPGGLGNAATATGTIVANGPGTVTLGGALGAAGAGAFGGALGGYLGTATNSKVVGGLSGAALSAGGAYLANLVGLSAAGGPIGLAIGAVVGGIMGLIGTQKASVGPNSRANLIYQDGSFQRGTSGADNGGDVTKTQSLVDNVAAALNAIKAAAGIKNAQDMAIGAFNLMEQDGRYSTDIGGTTKDFTDPASAVASFLADAVGRFMANGSTEWTSENGKVVADNLKKALDASVGKPAEELVANLTFAASDFAHLYDTVGQAQGDDFSQQLTTLSVSYQTAKQKAADLGLTTTGMADSFAKAADRLFASAGRAVDGMAFVDNMVSAWKSWETSSIALMGAGLSPQPAMDLLGKQWQAILISVGDDIPALEKLTEAAKTLRAMGQDVAADWAQARAAQVQDSVMQSLALRQQQANAQILAATNDAGAQAAQDAYDMAVLLGNQQQELAATTNDVVKAKLLEVQASERQALAAQQMAAAAKEAEQAQQAFASASSNTRSYLLSLLTGSAGGLNAQDQYANAKSAYTAASAAIGPQATADQLNAQLEAGKALIDASRQLNGSTTAYFQDLASVTSDLAKSAQLTPDDPVVVAINALKESVDKLGDAISVQVTVDAINFVKSEIEQTIRTYVSTAGLSPREVQVATGLLADITQTVDVALSPSTGLTARELELYQGALSNIDQAITAVVDTSGLSGANREIALGQLSGVTRTINAALGEMPALTAAQAEFVLGASRDFTRTLNGALGVMPNLSANDQAILLGQTDAFTKTFNAVAGLAPSLNDEQAAILAGVSTSFTKAFNAVASALPALSADQRAILFGQNDAFTRTFNQAIAALPGMSPEQQAILLGTTDSFTKAFNAVVAALPGMSDAQRAILLGQNDAFTRTFNQAIAALPGMSDAQRAILLGVNDGFTRVFSATAAALPTMSSAQQAILLGINDAFTRTYEQAIGVLPQMSYAQQAILQGYTSSFTKTYYSVAAALPSLSAAQLSILQGYTDAFTKTFVAATNDLVLSDDERAVLDAQDATIKQVLTQFVTKDVTETVTSTAMRDLTTGFQTISLQTTSLIIKQLFDLGSIMTSGFVNVVRAVTGNWTWGSDLSAGASPHVLNTQEAQYIARYADLADAWISNPAWDPTHHYLTDGIKEGRAFANGGVVGAYAAGGIVGNGIWGKDSVLARYADGGMIALAGGEYVMPSAMTDRYRGLLDSMRSGTLAVANDADPPMPRFATPTASRGTDGLAAVVAELRAVRAELEASRRENAEMMRRQSLMEDTGRKEQTATLSKALASKPAVATRAA